MNQDLIKFKKERELGEILSVTFQFIRQNYQTAGKIFLKIVGPIFILLVAAVTYYSWSTLGSALVLNERMDGTNFIIALAVLVFAYLLYSSAMLGCIYHIINSYINNSGAISQTEVIQGMKADFGKLILLTFICWVMVFTGMLFFIIPGIYLAVPLSLSAAILVFRRNGVVESISESFQLVKDNWWMSFASLLCIGLIVYLVGLVFQLPAIFYYLIRAFTVVQEGSAAQPGDIMGTGMIIVNVITSIIQYLVYSIGPIGIALVYFNLNEKQHFTGTYETIKNLGKNK